MQITVEIEIRLLDGSDAADFSKIRLSALANFPAMFGSQYSTEAARELVWFEERIARSAALGAYIIGLMVLTIESGEKDRHKAYLSSVYVGQVHQRSAIASRQNRDVSDRPR